MARPLRPNPPPLELDGRWNVIVGKKKVPKKFFFFIYGPALQPPPPLNGPAIKRRTVPSEYTGSRGIHFQVTHGTLCLYATEL